MLVLYLLQVLHISLHTLIRYALCLETQQRGVDFLEELLVLGPVQLLLQAPFSDLPVHGHIALTLLLLEDS